MTKFMNEDGTYKYREPNRISLEEIKKNIKAFGSKRIMFISRGLLPVLKQKDEDIGSIHSMVWDIQDIGVIEDLRIKGNFYHAVLKAAAHADFQGKRILALKNKSKNTSIDERKIIKDIYDDKKNKCQKKVERIGELNLCGVIEALFDIKIIDNIEDDILTNIRKMSNDLRHVIDADYILDEQKADETLKGTVQILLRLREIPVNISESEKISGHEWENFWEDIFKSYWIV